MCQMCQMHKDKIGLPTDNLKRMDPVCMGVGVGKMDHSCSMSAHSALVVLWRHFCGRKEVFDGRGSSTIAKVLSN